MTLGVLLLILKDNVSRQLFLQDVKTGRLDINCLKLIVKTSFWYRKWAK